MTIRLTAGKIRRPKAVVPPKKVEVSFDSAAIIASNTALSQLRMAIIILRNTDDPKQVNNLKLHIQRLLDAPEETLLIDYIIPFVNFVPGEPIKARDQLSVIQKSLALIGMDLDIPYADEPDEKSWGLIWRGKRARLFWTQSSGWKVTIYLAQGDYACNFDLDNFLTQIGVDRSWWSTAW